MEDVGMVGSWNDVSKAAQTLMRMGSIQGVAIVSLQKFGEGEYDAVRIDGNGVGYDDGTLDKVMREAPQKFSDAVSFRLFIERMKAYGSGEPWYETLTVVYLAAKQAPDVVRPRGLLHKSLRITQFSAVIGSCGYLGD